ncbi:hypothetical protein D6C98_10669 [Aureobasidium pullulans]|nr:hypothetical protein D6C98_10669 [Aureobasidium pullulans]
MTIQNTPKLAIVGSSIVGLICALGLIDRGINVRVYEQANGLRENGAGLAFTRNAVECLRLVSPLASEALRSWVNGFIQHDQNDPMYKPVLFKLFVGANGFEGCYRAHLLEALWKRLPSGSVIFSKKLQTIDDDPHNNKAILHFMDGSTAQADAVIGCDGIKSRTRALLLGSDHPASKPQYTHKLSYRALIPMEKAIAALGAQKALNQSFNTNCDPWTGDNGRLIAPATRQEVVKAFKDWNKPVRTITEMFPEVGEKWAVFNSYEYPVPFYSKGRVCLASDSAHAAAPHHGAGAGAGVEDVLCLITAIDKALLLATPKTALTNAFSIYDGMRYEQSSHEVCEMYELDHPLTKGDMGKCKDEIEARSHKI